MSTAWPRKTVHSDSSLDHSVQADTAREMANNLLKMLTKWECNFLVIIYQNANVDMFRNK